MKLTPPFSTPDIAESLSVQVRQERAERHKCFLKIVSNLRFLAKQGLPLWRHGAEENDSNFMQLLRLKERSHEACCNPLPMHI